MRSKVLLDTTAKSSVHSYMICNLVLSLNHIIYMMMCDNMMMHIISNTNTLGNRAFYLTEKNRTVILKTNT